MSLNYFSCQSVFKTYKCKSYTLTTDVEAGGSLQGAIDAAPPNGTVFVGPGTYTEIITIDKPLTLLSTEGRDRTTILRPPGNTSLGTVLVKPNTAEVTIGAAQQGFTIVGGDSPTPAIEFAALYFQGGGHANHEVEGNVIIAGGDAGLMTEFNPVLDGLRIENNIFRGKTFVGPEPAAGDQFTVENVARQMVVIGGGPGVTNTQNVTFARNRVEGQSGANGVGNVGVTIDVLEGEIVQNIFTIDTGGQRAALRVRGPDSVVADNFFAGNNTGFVGPS